MRKKVCIIGAGAAGLIAAGTAAQHSNDVYLFEKNNKLGRKILITGKGRCNVTNNCDLQTFMSNMTSNGKFLYSAFSTFSSKDLINFIESRGVPLKTERGNRVFPQSDKSIDIVNAFIKYLSENNVNIINKAVTDILIENDKVNAIRAGNETIECDSVIICTGGVSYPITGSTGDGYRFAHSAGHTIIAPKPSLVPLVIKEDWCRELQGLSLKNVSIKIVNKKTGKKIYDDFGEMLFTHFGVSGPLVLSASAHLKTIVKDQYKLIIDLKPALSMEQLDNRLQRDFNKYINKDFRNSINELLPRKIIPVIVKLSGIAPEQKVNSIRKEQRLKLAEIIKSLELNILDFRPIDEAIVTSGGVAVNEINPKTMESKLVKGLYFAGEVIDVDAYTGGFNLQIAFSTGYLAGISV